MNRRDLIDGVLEVFNRCSGNTVIMEGNGPNSELTMFEPPLVGIASADDPLFEKFKSADVIGPWFMAPSDWLPGAASVISAFLPFTERVRVSNRGDLMNISTEWLYGRVEGQKFIAAFTDGLCSWLRERGVECCAPSCDSRFRQFRAGQGLEGYLEANEHTFGSNWSERHTAYACGLGTFGLSRGIITAKGMAGRFTSIIMNAAIEPDKRPYSGVYDYCINCGACVRRCPVNAISAERGKEHAPCSRWQDETAKRYAPRYGCGKCQTGVPCEARNPKASH